jgi:hypothetical protein
MFASVLCVSRKKEIRPNYFVWATSEPLLQFWALESKSPTLPPLVLTIERRSTGRCARLAGIVAQCGLS